MKVALASCLAYRPRLLVMDEPLSALDALTRDELIEGPIFARDTVLRDWIWGALALPAPFRRFSSPHVREPGLISRVSR
jgi:ABC-type uncharacterized transport system YnjBCD ATPase subunit